MPMPRKPDIEKYCAHCGKKMERKRYSGTLEDNRGFARRKFCNLKCMGESQKGMKVVGDRNGRREAHKSVKDSCELCGVSKSVKTLVVHHIDENPTNNIDTNLQTLCGKCHRRVHSPNYSGPSLIRKRCDLCEAPSYKIGLCSTHLTRRRRYGHPSYRRIRQGVNWILIQDADAAQWKHPFEIGDEAV